MIYEPICAIATYPAISAIGIIRCSGDKSWDLVQKFVSFSNKPKSRKMYLREFIDDNEVMDEINCVFYESPRTYTGENMVELFFHGSPVVLKTALEKLIGAGFREAQPGEFTKRAVMNGKMDLLKAESIESIVNAHTKEALKAAVTSYKGGLSKAIDRIRNKMVNLLAEIEVVLNYPDEMDVSREKIDNELTRIIKNLQELLKHGSNGIILTHGVKTVIAGRTNVGKSTLLNALLRRDRAIVTEVPGTTRDTIEEGLSISGVYFRIIDTAGIRPASDSVEKLGIDRSLRELEQADLVLFMIDLTSPKEDLELYEYYKTLFNNVIIVGNKRDKAKEVPEYVDVSVSALKGSGLRELENTMLKVTENLRRIHHGELFVSERQRGSVKKAMDLLVETKNALDEGITVDIISSHINQSIRIIDELTGASVQDDIMNAIFSNFCVGK
ncbi:MAG: tRNA uridine-5-carboxymethylaminomethyl(34) synthesis GTPase MnmE [Kosmotoga sp.]|nr:MAG: tRNA uridine-5-carboxymethylaminomethyl(34) synthesis GTPase MnmE [Kosmotoga sp.]